MNVSPNELRKETVATLKEVDACIESIKEEARFRNIDPAKMVDYRGAWVLPPLLLAKSQCLATLTLLNDPGRR